MFKSVSRYRRAKRVLTERLYEQAATEIERGIQRKGLWAKALADAQFDRDKAKTFYLNARVQSLLDEAAELQERQPEPAQDAAAKRETKPESRPASTGVALQAISDSTDDPAPTRSWKRFVFWLLVGFLGLQLANFGLGKPFDLSPFAITGNVGWLFIMLGDGGFSSTVSGVLLIWLCFAFWRAWRALGVDTAKTLPPRWGWFTVWIAISMACFQALNFLLFGAPVKLSPIGFLEQVGWRLLSLGDGDLSTFMIASIPLLCLLFTLWKAFRSAFPKAA